MANDPDAWKDKIVLSHIRHSLLRRKIIRLLKKHMCMFSGNLCTVHATTNHIELKPVVAPTRQQPYRPVPEKRKQICE